MSHQIPEFLQTPPAQAVILLAVVLIMSIVGVYVSLRFRDGAEQKDTSSNMLTKFREMRQQGHLDDTEYRTIKTSLSEKLHEELNDDGDAD